MPSKFLTSPFDGKGNVKVFSFGGGANEIFATVDPAAPNQGYVIFLGGGDDTVTGSAASDTITGGDGSDNILGGLGDDTIYGGNQDGSDKAKGKGGIVANSLYGDDRFVDGNGGSYTGGNDTLVGGADGFNTLIGDAQSAFNGTFQGGNDVLVSGTNARDTMVGDFGNGHSADRVGGADVFVFGLNNGEDLVVDFELNKDKVDLSAYTGLSGVGSLTDLWTTQGGEMGAQLTLDLDGTRDGMGDTITFAGYFAGDEANFGNDEFIFAIA